MAHVRTQIRDRVAAILAGTATAGSRVFSSRVDNMTPDDMPGICVYTGAEKADENDSTLTATAKVVDLIIDVYAAGTDYDDVADKVQAEVEAKLFVDRANGRYFNGLALNLLYDQSDKKYNGEAAYNYGIVRAIYKVKYITNDGYAETAI